MKKLILLFLVSVVGAMAMDEKEQKAVHCDLCTIMKGTALDRKSGDIACFVDMPAINTQVTQGNSRLPILMRKNRKKPDHYLISTAQHRDDTHDILYNAIGECFGTRFCSILVYGWKYKPHAYICARFSDPRTPEDNNPNAQHPCMFGVSNDDASVDPADFVFHGTEQSESIPIQIDSVPMLTLSGPANQNIVVIQQSKVINDTTSIPLTQPNTITELDQTDKKCNIQ